jgi:hypothetical protein
MAEFYYKYWQLLSGIGGLRKYLSLKKVGSKKIVNLNQENTLYRTRSHKNL